MMDCVSLRRFEALGDVQMGKIKRFRIRTGFLRHYGPRTSFSLVSSPTALAATDAPSQPDACAAVQKWPMPTTKLATDGADRRGWNASPASAWNTRPFT